jgi:hypothetical protein
MAEALILTCDECGRPAIKTVTIKVDSRNRNKDLCQKDLDAILAHTRVPRPGRKAATIAVPAKRRGRPPKTGKVVTLTANGKRRGRPPKVRPESEGAVAAS